MACKQESSGKDTEILKEVLHSVVELHVSNSTDQIITTIKDEARVFAEACNTELNKDLNRLIDGHNAIVDKVNEFSDTQMELTNAVINQMPQFIQKATHSEHISYKLRGQLGSTERKRRKVDLIEIDRLRHELGVSSLQLRNKDKIIETLSTRVNVMSNKLDAVNIRLALLSNEHEEAMLEKQKAMEEEFACVHSKQEELMKEVHGLRDMLAKALAHIPQ